MWTDEYACPAAHLRGSSGSACPAACRASARGNRRATSGGLAALLAAGTDQAVDVGLLDQLQRGLGNATQKIRVTALRRKLGQR